MLNGRKMCTFFAPPADAEVYLNLKIVKDIREGLKPCLKVWRDKQSYPFVNYSFPTVEKLEEYLADVKAKVEKRLAEEEVEKKAKQEAKENFVNPFKVGDILYSSWGYDQTNIDFFKIVAVGKKSVTFVEIGEKYIETGFMCGNTKPNPDHIIDGIEYTRPVKFFQRYVKNVPCDVNAIENCYVSYGRHNLNYTSVNEEHYESSYA